MRFFPCLAPAGEILVHERMEAGIVAGLQQVAQFMNHHVLCTPLRQQQQIDGEADAAVLHPAHAPARYHRLIAHGRRPDAHHLRVTLYHRFQQRPRPSVCQLYGHSSVSDCVQLIPYTSYWNHKHAIGALVCVLPNSCEYHHKRRLGHASGIDGLRQSL